MSPLAVIESFNFGSSWTSTLSGTHHKWKIPSKTFKTIMSFFVILACLISAVMTSDSKPMDGLSCRQVTPAQQLCTGNNEDYAIGLTYIIKDETLHPTLMHDGYGRLRFVFQDEENNKTQAIRLVTCK
uniref:Uncharacterized protein n=1 Tax=Strigamia maritima TaxID=126957 RepID=T1JBV0_STRMM